MTQDAKKYSDAKFANWEPTAGWGSANWNYQGYSKKKRGLDTLATNQGETRDHEEETSCEVASCEEARDYEEEINEEEVEDEPEGTED
jgi:hypothetical protein